MAGQGAKGGGQVAMPAAQAMGGPLMPSAGMRGSSTSNVPAIPTADPYRRMPLQGAGSPSAMGPQAALGGPPLGGELTNVPTMGGPNAIQTEAAIVGQRPRITDAMGNPQG